MFPGEKSLKLPANKITRIHVDYGEIRIANLVRAAGGRWNRQSKVRELPYREVMAPGHKDRIVDLADDRLMKNSKQVIKEMSISRHFHLSSIIYFFNKSLFSRK
ncbi:MAG: hypothetical protein MUC95_02640, partial [Spirochaetes bacterium]|nr:hypothetical protein [Spirochaetota bacterium]